MAYSKGLHTRLIRRFVVCVSLAAMLLPAVTASAYKQPNKHHYTSQESRQRPDQYRRANRYGKGDAFKRFKVKKINVSHLKKSSFWNKKPYQFATPVVVGEKLYVGVDAGVFYAFRVPRVKKLWKFKTKGPVQAQAAVADGSVFVGDGKGFVYALDAETGDLKWTATLDTEIMAQPLILGATLYIPTMSGRMYALDTGTGAEIWHTAADEKEFGFSVRGSASPTAGYGLIFQGTATGEVRAIRQSDGATMWTTRLGSPQNRVYDVDSEPLLLDGQLYAASADGLLYSMDPNDGSITWASDAGGLNNIVSSDGRLFTTAGGMLYCLDPATGLVFWNQDFEKPAMSSPAAGDGFITVVSTIDKIYVVESATGDVAFERYVRKGSLGDPIVVDEKYVYVLSNSGRLFSFEVSRVEPKEPRQLRSARSDDVLGTDVRNIGDAPGTAPAKPQK
jgi:outer membrane protein assembly factor BamB